MTNAKFQYFATFFVDLFALTYGVACGWSSPNMPFLSSKHTPLDQPLTIEEISMAAALVCIGGLAGNILFAWASNKFGKRYPLMSMAVPNIIGWMLVMYAKNPFHLYIARISIGLVGGGVFVVAPGFLSEIAEERIRGMLGSSLVFFSNLGTLLGFMFGDYFNYYFTPMFSITLTLIFLCGFWFCHESPAALYQMNRLEDAEKSLRFYRSLDPQNKIEMEILQAERNKLQLAMGGATSKQSVDDTQFRWSDFAMPAARKAMIIGIGLAMLNQLCGVFAIINYTSSIFKQAGSTMSPNGASTVVGFIQLIGSVVSTILVDRAGRKFLLLISAVAGSLGLASLGTYLYMQTLGYDLSSLGWVPIACLSFSIFFLNWGIIPLTCLVFAEIMPVKVRDAGVSICMVVLSFLAFLLVKYFPMLSIAWGMHGAMFLFAGCSMAGAIFLMILLPETKGKSFDEILELLSR